MRILVGMSGGIDSSMAAYLLKSQGHEVIGVTMTVWSNEDPGSAGDENSCFSSHKAKDLEDAIQICRKIGIAHETLDLSDLFEQEVLRNFRQEYMNARTPNPCVICNQRIKFGAMIEQAHRMLDFDAFATGHYARIKNQGRFCLQRAADTLKDQSYFLYRLSQKQLSTTLFPLGELQKKDLRALDAELGFHPEGQSESQDFYSGSYTNLIKEPPKEGLIVDQEGHRLGTHKGFWNYTIGQRRGLGIASPYPLYVVDLDSQRNLVTVGPRELAYSSVARAEDLVWGSIDHLDSPIEAYAKIRSTGEPQKVIAQGDGKSLKVEFETPALASTPGQSLVLYDKDGFILCGGIIS
jgi:tRNA-specific 2-thiouridylase